jgi:hypothetical protein
VLKYIIGFVAGFIFWIIVLYLVPMPEQGYKIIDCGMAEWHPDMPAEVREECRKQRRSRGVVI